MFDSLSDFFHGFSEFGSFGIGPLESATDYFTGYTSANQAWRFTEQGMALQDQYQRNLMRDSPSIQREGLEQAGFNPLLAIQGGVSSPSSAVSYTAPQPKGIGLGDIINAVSAAFGNYASLAKLGGDVALTHAQADATRANSAADVALKGAQAAKTLKESASIEPDIIKRHNRYGTSAFGRAIEDITLKVSDALDINSRLRDAKSKQSKALKNVSTNSAKGLDGAVKVINEKMHRAEKRRGDAVRKRRALH